MNKRQKRKMRKAAARAPNWVRHVAATKTGRKPKFAGQTFGPASVVRVLMKDGKPTSAVDG